MTKKQGTFLPPKSYQFTVEEPVVLSSTVFSPSIPAKTTVPASKPQPKRVQSARVLSKKPLESQSSFNSLDINISPNYPEPIARTTQRPVSVKQILCQYEQEISDYNMIPLKVDLKPHILQSIQQQSLSKTGKTLDLYNKNKGKTITEIRTREKFQSKADSAVKVWLDQLEQEQNKQSTKFTQSFEAFQKAQARLDRELQVLMAKVQITKEKNAQAFHGLAQKAEEIIKDEKVNFDGFTCAGKPVKGKVDNQIRTQVKVYGQLKDYSRGIVIDDKPKNQTEGNNECLISDDESFMNGISSPEDFEVLSDEEL